MSRVAEVWAVVQCRGETWTGRMVTSRGLDQPRVAFGPGAGPESLALGARVELGLATRKMARAARCGALLLAVEWSPEGVELTFDPDEPELFREAIPGLATGRPERRASLRVFPRTGEGIRVPVHPQDLAAGAVVARLCDASVGGMGLLFPYEAEVRLCFSRVLLCEIADADGVRRQVECRVQNRTLQDDGVRYGVEFPRSSPGPEFVGDNVVQPFEPLWDCPCGATGLLAASHLRCLRCGRARSTNTRLPQRDGLLSLTAHVYTGTARTCKPCGAQWSIAAKFCGRCGFRF